jgi:hypothetical protein
MRSRGPVRRPGPTSADASELSRLALLRAESSLRRGADRLVGAVHTTPTDPDAEGQSVDLGNSDPALGQAHDVAAALDRLLTWVADDRNAPLVEAVRTDPLYYEAVTGLDEAVRTLRNHLRATGHWDDPHGLHGVQDAATAVVIQVEHLVGLLRSGAARRGPGDLQDDGLAFLDEVGDEVAGLRVAAAARRAFRSAADPAAADGARGIGLELDAVAAGELRAARLWRCISITTMGLIAGIAAAILFGTPLATGTLHGDFTRLSITVPLAALAAYLVAAPRPGRARPRPRPAPAVSQHLQRASGRGRRTAVPLRARPARVASAGPTAGRRPGDGGGGGARAADRGVAQPHGGTRCLEGVNGAGARTFSMDMLADGRPGDHRP